MSRRSLVVLLTILTLLIATALLLTPVEGRAEGETPINGSGNPAPTPIHGARS